MSDNLSTILKNYQLYTKLSHEFERKFWEKLKDQYNLTDNELNFLKQWDPWVEALVYTNCKIGIKTIGKTINEMRNGKNIEFEDFI